jgi:phage replication O-like protein O
MTTDGRPPPGGWFPVLNSYVDDHLAELTGAETKVLLYLVRCTAGWHKDGDRVSRAQIGRVTGLNKATVSAAVKGLCDRGLLSIDRPHDRAGRMDVNTYHVAFSSHVNLRPTWRSDSFPGGRPFTRLITGGGPTATA